MNANSSRSRRQNALRAGFLGQTEPTAQAIEDPDPLVRVAGLRSRQRLDALTDGELSAALTDPDPRVRITGLEIAAGRTEPAIRHLLDDPLPAVVEAAAWACGERTEDPNPPIEPLAQLAQNHDDPLVREAAVAALGALGDDGGLPAILAATEDKPAIRRRAVLALASFDGPEVDQAWLRARSDRDRQVRDAVEELLGPAPTD